MRNNLASRIEGGLPPSLTAVLRVVGKLAQKRGVSLYLVGGVVRDLLLKRPNFDLDLVVDGDAIPLAREITEAMPGKITVHHRFGTAKIQYPDFSLDLATARTEHYPRPGALPVTRPGTIRDDLYRRDFTINAMAVRLGTPGYGDLIDPYGGLNDLKYKLIRILHDQSFRDDATRIWRALRYQQRLDFGIEDRTLSLLKENISMLGTISGDRIRYELECLFKEAQPEKGLRQAAELGVLKSLHPALTANDGLEELFKRARALSEPDPPTFALYLALLAYRLTSDENEDLISRLRLPKLLAQTLRDTISVKAKLGSLAEPELAPSGIYSLLHGYSPLAITANSLASDSPLARRHIHLFLDKLRYVKPILTGNDLKKMGIAPGPRIKEILARLRSARLDGEVSGKREEEELVEGWLGG